MPSAPAAAALRISVPAFPGSETTSHAATNVAFAVRWSSAAVSMRAIANSAWVWRVSAMRTETPGASVRVAIPAAAA